VSDKPIPPSVAQHALQTCLRENGEQIGMAATIAQQAELIRLQAAEIAALKQSGVVLPDENSVMRLVLREMGRSTYVRGTSNWCADIGMAVVREVARINASHDAVPEGWRLVPLEPTVEMIEAGAQVPCDPYADSDEEEADAVSARAGVTVDAGVFACDCVEHVHPEYGVGMFFTADALQTLYTAPPSPDAELVGLLTGLVEIASKRNRGRRGSPNHGHSMPGIWDSDNGDLAGKPCAECALYDLAVDKLADLRKEAP